MDFCLAERVGIHLYLTDLDGSLRLRLLGSGSGPGSIISEPLMAFVDESKCHVNKEQCHAYCEYCFRTIHYDIDPSGSDDYVLQVCNMAGSICIQISGSTNPNSDETIAGNFRAYQAHLPKGLYTSMFLDGLDGDVVWPTFVDTTVHDELCADGFDEGSVELRIPELELEQGDCAKLIKNGDCEVLEGWFGRPRGLTLARNSGVDGSAAVEKSPEQSDRGTIVQYLDTRCFKELQGRSYEVRVLVKLVDEDGTPKDCQAVQGCPDLLIIASDSDRVGAFVPQLAPGSGGYQLLHGMFRVEQKLTSRTKVEFAVRTRNVDYSMLVDDVSVDLMPTLRAGDPACIENLVYNGDFSSGDAAFWWRSSATMELVDRSDDQAGAYGLLLSKSTDQVPGQLTIGRVSLKTACFEAGERYHVSVQFKMRLDDQITVCDQIGNGNSECPSARVAAFKDGASSGQRIVEPLETRTGAEYSVLFGVFTATAEHVEADWMILELDNLKDQYKYQVNSVSIEVKPKDCNKNILVNSNMEMGVRPFWMAMGPGTVEWTTDGYDTSSSGALLSRGRESPNNGPRYNAKDFLDERCLVPGSTWQVNAQIKVLDAETGAPTVCNPHSLSSSHSEDACPSVRIEIKDSADNPVLDVYLMDYEENASDVNDWFKFSAALSLPGPDVWDGSVARGGVFIHMRDFPVELELVVDDFTVREVG